MTNPKPWRVIPKSEAAARPLGADRQDLRLEGHRALALPRSAESVEPVPVEQRPPQRIAFADGRRRRGP